MSGSRLFVGNLVYYATEDYLKELFSQYGKVTTVTIFPGQSFGFVEMAEAIGAENAINDLDGTVFEGKTIIVEEARPARKHDRRDNVARIILSHMQ